MFTFAGVLSSVITAIGDKIHYMNRDIKKYIYIAEALVGSFVVFSFVLGIIIIRRR